MKDIPKAYIASKYEDNIYSLWEKSGAFSPKIDKKKEPFCISMPPPNATGTLHLGHASMLALEDIMIRFHRMNGVPTLWLPGTDHAAIATQNKVERLIQLERKTRHQLGRIEFLKRVHKYVADSQDTIRNQIRKMGSSCDWSRERYTLDEGLNKAVREAFIRMYHDGVIYRGYRIVHWCPHCTSTLADDEVIYKEEKTLFYYLRYGPFVIGTARPETKFLDKIIVVHPQDARYKKYHSKKMTVPWIEGDVEAMILPDESVDMSFGTGAMTITPAHDFNDFEIAQRHKLDIVQIIDENGNLTSAAGSFKGMNARSARPQIIKKLEKKRLIESIDENYVHNLSVCYRCETPIEPLVSRQWFIDVNKKIIKDGKSKKSIKEKAIEAVRNGKITIIPDRFNKIYFHWMENLRDWCISRQIWFGHQIPAWYCMNKLCSRNSNSSTALDQDISLSSVIVPKDSDELPLYCPDCGKKSLHQDPDTLDTWFSSGLWTFSTLGWPDKTKDLQYFHPTSVLETGYDILFFWVARMIIMTTYHMNEIPFKTVYLHGLVRDKLGRKMSKSLDNGIDPLDMIAKFGADAVRLSLIVGGTPGNDIRLYEEKIAGFRNFINKIWNASRFVLLTIDESDLDKPILLKSLSSADKWLLSRLQRLIKESTLSIETYSFSEAGQQIYDFLWSEFCDWYVEMSKIHLSKPVLIHAMRTVLTLLHPFVPFVTEELWKYFNKDSLLINESWPKINEFYDFPDAEKAVSIVRDAITAIRSIRHEHSVESGKKIHVILYSKDYSGAIKAHSDFIKRSVRIEKLSIAKSGSKVENAVSKFIDGVEIFIPIAEMIDISKEKERLAREIIAQEEHIQSIEQKLDNPDFQKKAPKEVVRRDEERLKLARETLIKLQEQAGQLK